MSRRSFDGNAIHATVQDGASNIPVVFDFSDESARCTDQRHLRQRDLLCEHIAAALYAYVREPESFLPQNIGGFLDLLNNNPQAREQLAALDPGINAMLRQIEQMPESARAALENLPLNPTPQQLAQVAQANTPEAELAALLRRLTLAQLRAIAKRRDWQLTVTAQAQLADELALLLANTPLPTDLSSEEEQLLRIENTLYGFCDTPAPAALENMWRARGGGDLARLERAEHGLQTAGILFPCNENGAALHYHWSPFLNSESAPHLAPKTKLYPAEKIAQLKIAEPLMPLPTIIDAVIELAEREPLRARQTKSDPRWAQQPFAQGWDVDAAEMERFLKTRFFANNAITIAFSRLLTDETQNRLDTLGHEVGRWAAGFLLSSEMLKQDGEVVRVDSARAASWRAQSEEERWKFLWQGWRAGAVALAELQIATARASLAVQRITYAHQFKPVDLIAEMARARNFIARVLAPLDPLVWYSFKSFAESVRGLRGDFLYTETKPDTWFLVASKTGHRYDPHHAQNWDASYRVALGAIVDTTLRWLGVTEVAYEGKELAAFRITALGASLLAGGQIELTREPADPNAPALVWVDDTTIRLRATPDAARAMPTIRAFADPMRAPLTFAVTHASIARAFERGATVVEIAQHMANAGAPLPDALRAKMDALANNYGRAHVYEHLTVLELADDFALRELLAGTTFGQFIVHQFSPRLVVVRDENVDAWMSELVKKGYTPRVVSE